MEDAATSRSEIPGYPSQNSLSSSDRGEFQFMPYADQRIAFSTHSSFRQSDDSLRQPFLSRSLSAVNITGVALPDLQGEMSFKKSISSGNPAMRKLLALILLNVAYSTTELFIGLFTSRVGLVSDAFHLTFGCSLLSFSLFAMASARRKPDGVYTYGYKRLEVLAAFTNAIFLLFMSFSLAVEALHAFMQDESEHKHYLIVSAVTNLLVNLLGVWFFRSYARINIAYRKSEDMNYHSVCLHVLADSIRSAGLILASWLLALGVKNAEVLCLGLVSVMVFMVTIPLFRATGGILLQMAPSNIHPSAFSKCLRQVAGLGGVLEVSQARFWELVPGHIIGSLLIQVKKDTDTRQVMQYVHSLYHDIGVHDLTVQADCV